MRCKIETCFYQHRHRLMAPGRFISDHIRMRECLTRWTEYHWAWFLAMSYCLQAESSYQQHLITHITIHSFQIKLPKLHKYITIYMCICVHACVNIVVFLYGSKHIIMINTQLVIYLPVNKYYTSDKYSHVHTYYSLTLHCYDITYMCVSQC